MTITETPAATATATGLAFTAYRAALASAVAFAAKCLPRRPAVPILAGLMLDVSGGILTVTAFDYDQAGIATCNGEGATDGRMLVHGAELAAAVKAMPKATARRPLTVTLAATWPAPPAVPGLPEGELHNYQPVTDESASWMHEPACSCGWTLGRSVSARYGDHDHRDHIERVAPELAKILAARKIAQQPVTGTLTLDCDGARFTVGSLPADEYPALPPVPDVAGEVTGPAFARSVARACLAAGKDDTLPALTCVQVTPGLASITLAATDRYRLAVEEMAWYVVNADAVGNAVLIPARELGTFAKIAAKSPHVSLHFNDTHAALSTGDRTVIIRTNGGDFPRWSKLMPDTANILTMATVDAATLAGAVKSAGAMLPRNVALSLDFSAESVTLTAAGEGGAGAVRTVPCVTAGPTPVIAFNPAYLADALAGFAGAVRVYLTSAAKPALFTADGTDFRYLLMPIKRAS